MDTLHISELRETMETMLAHPEQGLVQAQACLTLYNFTSGNEHQALLNRVEATECGALEAIVAAMRTHREQRSVGMFICESRGACVPPTGSAVWIL